MTQNTSKETIEQLAHALIRVLSQPGAAESITSAIDRHMCQLIEEAVIRLDERINDLEQDRTRHFQNHKPQ